MKTVLSDGVIMNTAALSADAVLNRRVKCPACGLFTFQKWPEGWDAHAEFRCDGLDPGLGERRKEESKKRFAYLFR